MPFWTASTPLSSQSFNKHISTGLYGETPYHNHIFAAFRVQNTGAIIDVCGGANFSATIAATGEFTITFPQDLFDEAPIAVVSSSEWPPAIPPGYIQTGRPGAIVSACTDIGCTVKTWRLFGNGTAEPLSLDFSLMLLGKGPTTFWEDSDATPLTPSKLNKFPLGAVPQLRIIGGLATFDGDAVQVTNPVGFQPTGVGDSATGIYTVFHESPFTKILNTQISYHGSSSEFLLAGIEQLESDRLNFRCLDMTNTPITTGSAAFIGFGL